MMPAIPLITCMLPGVSIAIAVNSLRPKQNFAPATVLHRGRLWARVLGGQGEVLFCRVYEVSLVILFDACGFNFAAVYTRKRYCCGMW